MQLQELNRLKASLVIAPVEQVLKIEEAVRAIIARRVAEARLAQRTAATATARRCPHCATDGASLHGRTMRRDGWFTGVVLLDYALA